MYASSRPFSSARTNSLIGDPTEKFEHYMNSIPFGYIISQAHNLAQKLFDSHVTCSQHVTREVLSWCQATSSLTLSSVSYQNERESAQLIKYFSYFKILSGSCPGSLVAKQHRSAFRFSDASKAFCLLGIMIQKERHMALFLYHEPSRDRTL